MTYIYYIRKNNIKDSPEAFREYQTKTDKTFAAMPEKMKDQYVKATYLYRFSLCK